MLAERCMSRKCCLAFFTYYLKFTRTVALKLHISLGVTHAIFTTQINQTTLPIGLRCFCNQQNLVLLTEDLSKCLTQNANRYYENVALRTDFCRSLSCLFQCNALPFVCFASHKPLMCLTPPVYLHQPFLLCSSGFGNALTSAFAMGSKQSW